MTSTELIESGVCEDLSEVLRMYPLELLDDFNLEDETSGGAERGPSWDAD